MNDPAWYALHTRFGCERSVLDSAEELTHGEGFLPFMTEVPVDDQQAPPLLFHCYAFIKARMSEDLYAQLKKIDNVLSVVGAPSTIPESEIELLKRITLSPRLPQLGDEPLVGAQAQVIDGPMVGIQGVVVERRNRIAKLRVSLPVVGATCELSVPIDFLKNLSEELDFAKIPAKKAPHRGGRRMKRYLKNQ